METLAPPQYWNEVWRDHDIEYKPELVQFKELFDAYLPRGGECFEVGCYPGNYLIHLAKQFGYRVSGIDTTPFVLDRMPAHLRRQGVEVGALYHGDFFTHPAAPIYNVVCSFGFVEHFFDVEDVIRRHVALVAPGGTLVLTCPNFRGLQYLLHRTLDRSNLSRHVVASMDLRRWRRALEGEGMELLRHGRYRSFGFWTDGSDSPLRHRAALRVANAAKWVDARVRTPLPGLSPYLVSISRKPK